MKEWSDVFRIGIEDIDADHREMFEMMHRLYAAARKGKGGEEIGNVLSFLEGYIEEHFRREEEYMEQYHYPDRDLHKTKHKNFIKEFQKVKDEFLRNETADYLSLMIEGWLYNWLDDHFSHDDQALGKFLKSQIASRDDLEKE